MKNALLIALTLVSVSAFAGGKVSKAVRAEARKACKEVKGKAEHKACIEEKLKAPTQETMK
ncbi:MAG: hypothetical protein K2Q18_03210 [Bdellovibrionales bacterium]|nr:hypothetical protein [Bdellovibrionales bacterium]